MPELAAENIDEEIVIEEDKTEAEQPEEGSVDLEQPEQEADGEESFEVIDTGDEGGSQPTKEKMNVAMLRRVKRSKQRAQAAESAQSDTAAELQAERDKNKLLLMERSQRMEGAVEKQPPSAPNPDDFLYDDEGYQKALTIHNQEEMARNNEAQVKNYLEGLASEASGKEKERLAKEAFRQKLDDYDAKLNELNIKDAVDIEEEAIGAMGQQVHDFVILNSNVPHLVTIWAGKNPDKARDLADLAQRSLPQALMKLGELESRLKVRPKPSAAPAPDDELEPSRPSGTSGLQRKYDQLLKMDHSPEVHKQRRELRRKAQAEGVRLF